MQKKAATVIETAAVNTLAAMLDKGEVKIGDILKFAAMPGLLEKHDALLKACGDAGLGEGAIASDFVKVLATERDTLKAQVTELQTAAAAITKRVKLEGDTLKKGMWGLRQFAELLQNVAWLTQDQAWEADVEADGSKVPQALRDWLAQGAQIFSAMSAEEVAELVASVAPPAGTQTTIVAAEGTGDLGKAAAASADPAPAAAATLSAAPSGEGAGSAAAAPAPVAKAAATEQTPAEDPIQKALAANAELAEKLTKALGTIETLQADLTKTNERLAHIEQQPMPGKALLKAIGKGADVGTPEPTNQDVEPVRKADGSIDEAATALKAVHARGGMTLGYTTKP